MAKILLTAGPTREFLDPIRYLSNGSSGKMAAALAAAFLKLGWEVTVVSGPVSIDYPEGCEVVKVETTQQMLDACVYRMPEVNGVFAVAAPCDFRPVTFSDSKIKKKPDQETITITLEKTPDILATLGSWAQRLQPNLRPWLVGFALETENGVENATTKKREKGCQAIVLNQADAMGSDETKIKVIGKNDQIGLQCSGSKIEVAEKLADWATENLQATGQ